MKVVHKFPKYLIDTYGNIWAKKKHYYTKKQPSLSTGGYLEVSLQREGKQYTRKVHSLVLRTFIGPRPEDLQGCHNNGNKLDNRLDNLRWDTASANQLDRIKHGTDNKGVKNANAKLTKTKVLNIRKLLADGLSQRYIARKYGVKQAAIWSIHNHKTWTHI